MLQPPPARKHAFPIRFEITSGLVVHDLERGRIDLVDSVYPTGEAEPQSFPQRNDDRFSLIKRLRRSASGPSEGDLQTDRSPRSVALAFGLDKQLEVREKVTVFPIEDFVRWGWHLLPQPSECVSTLRQEPLQIVF